VAWSGYGTPATFTAGTGTNGVATVFSNKDFPGTFVATVTGVSCTSCTYDQSANVQTSNSITIP